MIIYFIYALVGLVTIVAGIVISFVSLSNGATWGVMSLLCLSPLGFIGMLISMFLAGRASRRYRVVVDDDRAAQTLRPSMRVGK